MYNLCIDTFITLQLSSDINEKPKKEPKIITKFLKKEKTEAMSPCWERITYQADE